MTASLQKFEPLSTDFLHEFKRATEAKWDLRFDPTIYGFQFRPGTRWNPGLSEKAIAEYQDSIGVQFPRDFKTLLRAMNGTDLPTLNTYGNSGHSPRQSVGVYSYPKDIDIVKQRIEHICTSRNEITADLGEQGFDLPAEAGLVPVSSIDT